MQIEVRGKKSAGKENPTILSKALPTQYYWTWSKVNHFLFLLLPVFVDDASSVIHVSFHRKILILTKSVWSSALWPGIEHVEISRIDSAVKTWKTVSIIFTIHDTVLEREY